MRAAVIGLGPHGRRVVESLQRLGLEIAAVVDQRADALAWPALPADTLRLTSTDELWARGRAELVCITTNGPSHAVLALAAIRAGARRVMVEKPMACSVADCRAMLAAAEQHGVRLSADQSRRHDPLYRWLRERIRSGDWGALRAIWIQRPGIGLGCLATHSFDLACFLADRPVRTVSGWVDAPVGVNPRGAQFVDPGGYVVLDLGGVRATVAQLEDGAGPMAVELDLTAARVRIDESSGEVEIIRRDLSVKPGPGVPPKYERETVPAHIATRPALPTMLDGVLGELAGDGPLDCAGEHGAHAVEVLVAAYLSDRAGHAPVALPLEQREQLELALPVT